MSGWRRRYTASYLARAYLVAGGLVAVLAALILAAVKARTRGGRAVALAAALLVLLAVLVAVPVIDRLPAWLNAAAEALRP
ncbi:MAG: hypothetical protein OXG39_09965 [Chloroflexi bacterium]|nr:hypothetical protein [Chloroflexota bacterium]